MDEQPSHPIRYADYDSVVIDESKVPEAFRHLVQYAKQWSIGDDPIRNEVMEKTSIEELKIFVDAVEPFFAEIVDWCDQYFGALNVPDEVILFQMMFEPLAEARIAVYGYSQRD